MKPYSFSISIMILGKKEGKFTNSCKRCDGKNSGKKKLINCGKCKITVCVECAEKFSDGIYWCRICRDKHIRTNSDQKRKKLGQSQLVSNLAPLRLFSNKTKL